MPHETPCAAFYYFYNYKDYTLVSFAKDNTGALEVIDTNNYYPFGLNHIEGMLSTSNFGGYYSYKYNGKELQETGMYDYGARFYMPDIGRWGVVDPLAEKMTRHSPYNYAFNNPLRFIDPDGREAEGWIKDKKTGEVSWDKNTNSQNEFNKNYKGRESSFAYVSNKNDSSKYTLPNGSGSLVMNDWVENSSEDGLIAPEITMTFIPSDKSSSSGWFQTYISNTPDYDGSEKSSIPGVLDERLDGEGLVQGSKDFTKPEYFDVPKLNTLHDAPQREYFGEKVDKNSSSAVKWNAQSSMIINGKASFTVKWGFTLFGTGSKDHKYNSPTIINSNNATKEHTNAIQYLHK
ncbi:RHS repeat-associated core domain-containing protein [Chryseobacterium sp. JK1]|uniref:RHS repeat-associated core domain-containing protein n=1 Tax=Chryseobacterium sp. JK1 TaxID=874294 RepID=UPI003D687E67